MAAALGTALVLWLVWFLREPEAPKARTDSRPAASRMQIEGLRFYGMNGGRRVISIAADRFTLRRGKIGFFSTGLTRTALIENGVIDIYATSAGTPEARASQPQGRSATISGSGPEASPGPSGGAPPEEIDFRGLFSEETFSSLMPVRSIAKIEIAPVTVRFQGERSVLTQVSAAQAEVRLKEREILFTGNIRVMSAGGVLTTERLSFYPDRGRLQTDRPFVLKQGRRTLEGTGLSTDIFLKTDILRK